MKQKTNRYTPEKIEVIFNAIDNDASGTISRAEFVGYFTNIRDPASHHGRFRKEMLAEMVNAEGLVMFLTHHTKAT